MEFLSAIIRTLEPGCSVFLLHLPKHGGHCWSLASLVSQQLKAEAASDLHPPVQDHTKPNCIEDNSFNSLNSLTAQVASKLEDGDFKGAVRLACSKDSIVAMNDETFV